MKGRSNLTLLVAVLLAGMSVGIALKPESTTAATTYTRAWSCQGRDFMPLSSDQTYGWENAMRRGGGYFQCDADIPHKAVVTKVRFSVYDNVGGPPGGLAAQVQQCALVRISLAVATVGAADVLASVPGTGPYEQPGNVRLSDTTIDYATIDRMNYAYYLQCSIDIDYPLLGIWGADVTYKITAANG